MKVLFLGTSGFVGSAGQVFDRLAHSPFRPSFVITEPDKPAGRKQILTPPPVKLSAKALGIPVIQPVNRAELLASVKEAEAELAIVAAYGRILRPEVLECIPDGFVNIHPSLVPRYRGPTPVQAAVLSGDTHTGVTIMLLDEGMDTGPILSQREVAILPDETAPDLADRLAELGTELLLNTLPDYLDGSLKPQPQPTEGVSVTSLLTKDSGRLTGTESPEHIIRMIHAYSPWPGVWAEIDGLRILLHDATLADRRVQPIRVQLAGKQPVDWLTFSRDRAALAKAFWTFLNR